jgi:phosphatidylethanolamine/phosphatidyl-N-methylethanolamine N-methyltransferase
MKHYLTFLKELGSNRESVGAVAPSTSKLGDSLSKFLQERTGNEPWTVLEVGPGTGTVTKRILKALRPGDQLTLVEVNDQFCKLLDQKARTRWKHLLKDVHFRIECCQLEDLDSSQKYDYVISALPLNNFSYDEVKKILDHYQTLLKPGGKLSYFEYLYIREIQKKLNGIRNNRDKINTYYLLENFIQNFQVESDKVFLNFPPAVARHFSFNRRPPISQNITS